MEEMNGLNNCKVDFLEDYFVISYGFKATYVERTAPFGQRLFVHKLENTAAHGGSSIFVEIDEV